MGPAHSDLPLKEIAHCADAAIAADAVQPNKPTTTTYLLQVILHNAVLEKIVFVLKLCASVSTFLTLLLLLPFRYQRTLTRPNSLDSPCTQPASFGWLSFPSTLGRETHLRFTTYSTTTTTTAVTHTATKP